MKNLSIINNKYYYNYNSFEFFKNIICDLSLVNCRIHDDDLIYLNHFEKKLNLSRNCITNLGLIHL